MGREKFFQPQVGREEKSLGTYDLKNVVFMFINEKLNKEDISYIYSIKTFDYFFQNKRQRVHKCYFHNPYSRVILIEIVNQ